MLRQNSITSRPLPSMRLAVFTALISVATMALLRLWLNRSAITPIGYGVPVVIIAWFRRRNLLWITVGLLAAITLVKLAIPAPSAPSGVFTDTPFIAAGLVLLDLLVVAGVADLWINGESALHSQNVNLERLNGELAVREEEIARQNEELQSQTEELERQSEELRVANEELVRREKRLEILLSLSRSLTTELSRGDVMGRICETLGVLVSGPGAAAAAVLEQDGNIMHVRCHHGFGEKGLRDKTIPSGQAFASLVLARGRTGYLEDLSLRPDLQVPQPAEGDPVQAVLSVPLRVGGWPVGTLEAYARQKTAWTDEQITLVESLAAQTAVSLEASKLFDDVNRERSRFEAVLRTVPLAIAACSRDCSEIRVNPAGAVLFNVSADANIARELGHGPVRLFRDGQELPPAQYPMVTAALQGRETFREELELFAADGRRSVLLCNARPIRDSDGQLAGGLAAFVDITPQKDLQRELDLRRREAEEASVRKTRFLAAVSHDIRTPANAISLLAELTKRTAANPAMIGDVPELVGELHASSVSLVNLLSDVLDIARFDSGRVELQETEFLLSQLLEGERTHLLPLARHKGLELIVVPPSESISLRTDRIKLSRILGNLLGNAIKFTEKGRVTVAAELSSDANIRIRVSDTGIGIAQEHLVHIFDEFFQLRNPERDRNKGTGLGLTICKRLVDAMGGSLEVQSVVGEGTTFTVSLPASCVLPRVTEAKA